MLSVLPQAYMCTGIQYTHSVHAFSTHTHRERHTHTRMDTHTDTDIHTHTHTGTPTHTQSIIHSSAQKRITLMVTKYLFF